MDDSNDAVEHRLARFCKVYAGMEFLRAVCNFYCTNCTFFFWFYREVMKEY